MLLARWSQRWFSCPSGISTKLTKKIKLWLRSHPLCKGFNTTIQQLQRMGYSPLSFAGVDAGPSFDHSPLFSSSFNLSPPSLAPRILCYKIIYFVKCLEHLLPLSPLTNRKSLPLSHHYYPWPSSLSPLYFPHLSSPFFQILVCYSHCYKDFRSTSKVEFEAHLEETNF